MTGFSGYPTGPGASSKDSRSRASSGDADTYVKQSVFPGCFANGLPASEGAALAAEQEPLAASALSESLTAEIAAPHLSMISNPGAVTRVILNAAHTAG